MKRQDSTARHLDTVFTTVAILVYSTAMGASLGMLSEPYESSFTNFAAWKDNGQSSAYGAPGASALPPLGWSGFILWNSSHNERLALTVGIPLMRQLISSSGYKYYYLYDCTWATNRDANGKLAWEPTRFPHGNQIVDWIHTNGLLAGAYLSIGIAQTVDSSGPGTDTLQKARDDAEFICAQGFDEIYLDYCCYTNTLEETVAIMREVSAAAQNYCASNMLRTPVITMAGKTPAWRQGFASAANGMLLTGPAGDTQMGDPWHSTSNRLFNCLALQPQLRPGYFPYMGGVTPAIGAGGELVASNYAAMNFALSMMMESPVNPDRFWWWNPTNNRIYYPYTYLTNQTLLSIGQDMAYQPARIVYSNNFVWVIAKKLSDGSRAVAFVNLDIHQARTIICPLEVLDTHRNGGLFWEAFSQSRLGWYTNSVTLTVPPPPGMLIYKVYEPVNNIMAGSLTINGGGGITEFYRFTPSCASIPVLDTLTITNSTDFYGNRVRAASYIASTNSGAAALDLDAGAKQVLDISGDVTITGPAHTDPFSVKAVEMHLVNTGSTVYSLRLPATMRTPDGRRVYHITNGSVDTILSVECQENRFTNGVVRSLW